jgi:hypothetical protein
MFLIFGILFLLLLCANAAAYFLGLTKRNWMYSLGVSMTYLHAAAWMSILMIIVGVLGYSPTIGSAFVITTASVILGYLTEQLQERLERSGTEP